MEVKYLISEGILTFPEGTKATDMIGFEKNDLVERIIVPKTVTRLGDLPAFPLYDLPSLKYIIVEDGNKVYDSRDNCNAVIETESNTLMIGCGNTIIPSTVERIYDFAFESCYSLERLQIPKSVKIINTYAFTSCYGLKEVTIPESVAVVEHGAFENCAYLKKVCFEGINIQLGENVFQYCHELCEICVPKAAIDYYKEQLPEDLHEIIIGK